jgi:hypothetical protein
MGNKASALKNLHSIKRFWRLQAEFIVNYTVAKCRAINLKICRWHQDSFRNRSQKFQVETLK